MPLRIKVQKHIATGVRTRCAARRISLRQFDDDTPLLAFALRFVGARGRCVAACFCVALRGMDGRCRVRDRAGFGGSGNTDGQCCNGREKLVALLHDENRVDLARFENGDVAYCLRNREVLDADKFRFQNWLAIFNKHGDDFMKVAIKFIERIALRVGTGKPRHKPCKEIGFGTTFDYGREISHCWLRCAG